MIFNEKKFYDSYQQAELMTDIEKNQLVEFNEYDPLSAISDLNEVQETWLQLSFRKKKENMNETGSRPSKSETGTSNIEKQAVSFIPKQLTTPKMISQHITITSFYQSRLIGDGKARFISMRITGDEGSETDEALKIASANAEIHDDALINKNVTQRRRKGKLLAKGPELSATNTASLNVIKSVVPRLRNSVDLNLVNVIEGKRSRQPNPKYAQMAAAQGGEKKYSRTSEFHTAFMAGIFHGPDPSKSSHRDDLPESPFHGRAMLNHSHSVGFKKATKIKYQALVQKGTGEMIKKQENQSTISVKGIFIYKHDSNGFLIKYKARLMIRGDLQSTHSEISGQNVYAVILTFKVFRTLMALMVAFNLKTRQLNAINAFFNFDYNDEIYCYMSKGYKEHEKMLKIKKILYDMRMSSLLGLKNLFLKCTKIELKQIFDEFCLFINHNEVFLFFYVDDIIIIYRFDQQQQIKEYMHCLKKIYEIRDLKKLKYFLEMRVLQKKNIVCLIQDFYCIKLAKDYDIETNKKTSTISLKDEMTLSLSSYEDEVDLIKLHEYRKMIKFICYSTIMTRLDVIKIAFKLTKFFINLEPDHLHAAIRCIQYLFHIKNLDIKYFAHENEEFTMKISKTFNVIVNKKKQVFETIIDASFANEFDRRNAKKYTFKLYENIIDGAFKKQLTISTFIMKTELLTLLHAEKELIGGLHLFQKFRFDSDQNLIIYNDNLQTIRILTSEIVKGQTRSLTMINENLTGWYDLLIKMEKNLFRLRKSFI